LIEDGLKDVLDAVSKAIEQKSEDMDKLSQLKNALDKKMNFAGTKVQIKPMFLKRVDERNTERIFEGDQVDDPTDTSHTHTRVSGPDNRAVDKLQLVVKWGGEPTHSARYQSQDLGESYRKDLLLMNRDALEDVTVFTSSERRVSTSGK